MREPAALLLSRCSLSNAQEEQGEEEGDFFLLLLLLLLLEFVCNLYGDVHDMKSVRDSGGGERERRLIDIQEGALDQDDARRTRQDEAR
jgi:hypothetical protein